MISLSTATKGTCRPLASTVLPVNHFTEFCKSEETTIQTSFALEPTNYQAAAYYKSGKIYIKSRSNYDMAYIFAF